MKKQIARFVALFIIVSLMAPVIMAQDVAGSAQGSIEVTTLANYQGLVNYGPVDACTDLVLENPAALVLVFWTTEESNSYLYSLGENFDSVLSFDHDTLKNSGLEGAEISGIKLYADPGTRINIFADGSGLPMSKHVCVHGDQYIVNPSQAAIEGNEFLHQQFLVDESE